MLSTPLRAACLFILACTLALPAATAPTPAANTRTREQIEALIDQAGKTPPDWWNSVPLHYPPSLDLTYSGPLKPWNPQRNLGQYIWDIVNPNPAKWKEGVRLMHHVLTVNKDNPKKVAETADHLGTMYHKLLRDWPRAVFWYRKALKLGDYNPDDYTLELSECYWRLGNKDMCLQELKTIESDDTHHAGVVKLWGDLGHFDEALRLAELKAKEDRADVGFRAAGDVCRLAGRTDQAVAYYEKALHTPNNWKGWTHHQERVRASLDAVKLFDQLDPKRVADGAWQSTVNGYAGPLTVEVKVKTGRIESVKVVQHKEKQFYTAIQDTTDRILQKQNLRGIDLTTGATITAEAIVNASAKAMAKGMK